MICTSTNGKRETWRLKTINKHENCRLRCFISPVMHFFLASANIPIKAEISSVSWCGTFRCVSTVPQSYQKKNKELHLWILEQHLKVEMFVRNPQHHIWRNSNMSYQHKLHRDGGGAMIRVCVAATTPGHLSVIELTLNFSLLHWSFYCCYMFEWN